MSYGTFGNYLSIGIITGLLLFGLGTLSAEEFSSDIDPIAMLKVADRARGGGLPGLTWEVSAITSEPGRKDREMRLRLLASEESSLAETLEPRRSRGTKILQVERNMWLSNPGLRQPISISPRQRLTGVAAIGDIAATNYAADYEAKLLLKEMIKGEQSYLLDLRARNRNATYDHILYWISVDRGVGIRSEFYSLSGMLLKTACFEYSNAIETNGFTFPFISRMTIKDAITEALTKLEFSSVSVHQIPQSVFDPASL